MKTMKLTEFRKLIREEVRKSLNEIGNTSNVHPWVLDGRGGLTVVNYINSIYPGKAQFILTNFSNGGHC